MTKNHEIKPKRILAGASPMELNKPRIWDNLRVFEDDKELNLANDFLNEYYAGGRQKADLLTLLEQTDLVAPNSLKEELIYWINASGKQKSRDRRSPNNVKIANAIIKEYIEHPHLEGEYDSRITELATQFNKTTSAVRTILSRRK